MTTNQIQVAIKQRFDFVDDYSGYVNLVMQIEITMPAPPTEGLKILLSSPDRKTIEWHVRVCDVRYDVYRGLYIAHAEPSVWGNADKEKIAIKNRLELLGWREV